MEYVLSIFGFASNFGEKVDSAFLSAYWHLRDHFLPHHRNNYHPHILGHRSLALLSALLISVKIFSIGVLSFGPVESAFSSAITQQNILNLTNDSRKSFNLSALTYNSLLEKAAQAKANDMLQKGYFSHTTPDGKSPWDFIAGAGYNYLSAGENLAVNFVEAEDVEDAWMNSPGHKANILNHNFQEIGIGISQGQYQGKNAIFVVQMFGSPVAQKVTLTDKPTIVAPALVAPEKTAEPIGHKEVLNQIIERAPVLKPQQTNEPVALATPIASELKFTETSFMQEDGMLKLSAKIFGDPVKVLAKFGNAAIMLVPKTDGSWFGQVSLTELSSKNLNLFLEAQDMSGQKADSQVGTFSGSTPENFNILPSTEQPGQTASFFGKVFHPKNFEQQFYLIVIAMLLSCLVLAIAIKRHIQHLPLIANTSLVIVLAVGLWLR